MKSIMRSIREHFFVITIVLITVVLAWNNYTPGTFLSGWDTLHPEFNFGLNFQRLIFGVFRSEQGLGAVTAHSHMSDLPRVILLYIFQYIMPLSFLRYSYVFLNLFLGPIGMYFFLEKVVLKNKTAALLGGLFYLLNLGTLQRFVVPFEMFTVQYGMLPWIFLSASLYLRDKGNTRMFLLLFAVVMLLSSPMAYAATLWYMNFAVFVIFLLTFSFASDLRKNFTLIRKAAALILTSLFVNSFWVLPNLYFVITSGASVASANINQLFSPQAFLYNKEFGNLKDIALIKNFLFDWSVYAQGGHFGNLLQEWIDYLNKPYMILVGYSFAIVSFMGIVYSIIKKNKIGLSFLPALLLVLFLLINDNSPTSSLYLFIQKNIPFFKEAFRFPGDKALGIFTFFFALYFGLGQMAIVSTVKKLPSLSVKPISILQTLLISALIIFYMLPAFRGNLISPFMRINIPNYYFDVFSYFNKQTDTGTIVNFPIHSPWGWEYYDWHKDKSLPAGRQASYQGAGFLWFGIKQPLLNRDFDRWNPLNEQYFREMSYAVYSKKEDAFKTVIRKYNIHYILLDKSIIAPENDQQILYLKELEELLDKLEKQNFVKMEAEFGEVRIFKILNGHSYAYLTKNNVKIAPKTKAYYEDFAYQKYNDYINAEGDESSSIFYPFRNLIDSQSHILDKRVSISQEGALLNYEKRKNPSLLYIENEDYIPADLFIERTNTAFSAKIYPKLPYANSSPSIIPIIANANISEKSLIVNINGTNNFVLENLENNAPFSLGTILLSTKKENKISIYPKVPDVIIEPDFSDTSFSLSPCEGKSSDQVIGLDKDINSFTIFGKGTPICMNIALPNIIQNTTKLNDTENLLLTTSFSYSGKPLSYICIADIKTGSCLTYSYKTISTNRFPLNLSYFALEKNDINNLSIKIFLDATQTGEIEKVKYSNIVFSLTNPIYSSSFSEDLIRQSISGVNLDAKKGSFLIPFSGEKEISKNITLLPKTSINCNPSSPLTHRVSKTIVGREKENYIEYESDEGVSCDHFSYHNLIQDQGYLLLVNSRNIKGLPLTMCVLNQISRHCDLYTNLSKSSEFKTDIFLIPPLQEGQKGYDIDIASLGIKGTKSINDLKSIEFIPFPYYFLSKIEDGQNQSESQKINIAKQKEYNPSLYSVSLGNNIENSTLIFSKSFDKGWRAYQINKKTAWTTLFPFIFGKELKNHVMVNNWANGWKLDPSTIEQSSNKTIIIVYLPQYLEYLGFILTLGTICFILLKTLKARIKI